MATTARVYLYCALSLIVACGFSACARVPNSTRHFKYSLDLTVANSHYLFERDIECYDIVGFSFELGHWMRETHTSGLIPSVARVGDDLAVAVQPQTNCASTDGRPQEFPGNVKVFRHPADPTVLYFVNRQSADPPIRVNREWTISTTRGAPRLAPTSDERLLQQRMLKVPNFTSVTVTQFPYDEWANSSAVVNYFAQFEKVTPAPSETASASSDLVGPVMQFPIWRTKLAARSAEPVGSELAFDGTNFVMPPAQLSQAGHAYRVGALASIKYKDVVFKLQGVRDLYDPETRTIYTFMTRQTPAW